MQQCIYDRRQTQAQLDSAQVALEGALKTIEANTGSVLQAKLEKADQVLEQLNTQI